MTARPSGAKPVRSDVSSSSFSTPLRKDKSAATQVIERDSSQLPSGSKAGATDRLTGALVALAAAGGSVPCGEYGGHELWFSGDPDEQQIAAARCLECSVIRECGAAAEENDERAGIWGGVVRSPNKKKLGVKVTDKAHGAKAASEVVLSRTDLPASASVPRAATGLHEEPDETRQPA